MRRAPAARAKIGTLRAWMSPAQRDGGILTRIPIAGRWRMRRAISCAFMQLFTILSTMNGIGNRFSELAFSFTLTQESRLKTSRSRGVMGVVGGSCRPMRAARLRIVDAFARSVSPLRRGAPSRTKGKWFIQPGAGRPCERGFASGSMVPCGNCSRRALRFACSSASGYAQRWPKRI